MPACARGASTNALMPSSTGATPAYLTTSRRETDRRQPGRSLTRAMVAIGRLTPRVEPPYLAPRRIEVAHEFGAFDAVNPAVVTLQHPAMLLIGAKGEPLP